MQWEEEYKKNGNDFSFSLQDSKQSLEEKNAVVMS